MKKRIRMIGRGMPISQSKPPLSIVVSCLEPDLTTNWAVSGSRSTWGYDFGREGRYGGVRFDTPNRGEGKTGYLRLRMECP
jgi:hypothetical protein